MSNRTSLIAGNWKMNLNLDESTNLVKAITESIVDLKGTDVLVAPPFTSLLSVKQAIGEARIFLAAQNMHWETNGAYTGEISGHMLFEAGCNHVILGHSERRAYFGETDKDVNRKIKAAFAHGLIPIVCIGETLEEYEADRTYEVVFRQAKMGLEGIQFDGEDGDGSNLVIAYEPVWAIGTGRAATPTDANEVIAEVIRPALEELFGGDMAQKIRVLYGGSVSGDNAKEFFSQSEIDGGLVGGASLKVSDFIQITLAAVQ